MTMRRLMRATCTLAACLLSIHQVEAAPATPALDAAIAAQTETDAAARASQQRVESLDDQTQTMAGRYRQALENTRSIRVYADNLRAQVEAQRDEIKSMESQLAAIETTKREVFPLMVKMVEKLANFVALDMPFLKEQRDRRVQNLKEVLLRADVTQSEKYRRILEAYQIEMEYGRTVESYEGAVDVNGTPKQVTFLRVGRIGLLYQTPDRLETGYWDANQKQWVIDNDLSTDVQDGLKVAQKKGAPELIWIPTPAPQEAG